VHLATFRILSPGKATRRKARYAFCNPDRVLFHPVFPRQGTYAGLQFLGKDNSPKPQTYPRDNGLTDGGSTPFRDVDSRRLDSRPIDPGQLR
jgi:hypothetical protein